MKNWPKEIQEERARIWATHGINQHKSIREWAKVIIKQAGDLYMTAFILDGKVSKAEKRKQIVQIAAACEEALNSQIWD